MSNIILIEGTSSVTDHRQDGVASSGGVSLASGQNILALGVLVLDLVEELLVDHGVTSRERSVGTVLVDGGGHTVTNGDGLKGDEDVAGVLVTDGDGVSNRRNVVTSVALTEDKEGATDVLGEGVQPTLQEVVHINGHLLLVVDVSGTRSRRRETSTSRLINEDNVRVKVPGVRVQSNLNTSLTIIIKIKGTVFVKDSQLRRATRATSHPQNKRILRGSSLRLKEPVEQLSSIGRVSLNGTSVLGESGRFGQPREGVELVGSGVSGRSRDEENEEESTKTSHFVSLKKKKKKKKEKKKRKKKKKKKPQAKSRVLKKNKGRPDHHRKKI